MRYKSHMTVLLLSIALAGAASASDIYKWTDDQGNVHYTDKPDHQPSERLSIESRRTDNSEVRGQVQARRESRAGAAEAAAAAAADNPTPDELRAEASERAENCSKSKERLTRFTQSRRMYRADENGERVYLDEAQVTAARDKVQQQVTENCKP